MCVCGINNNPCLYCMHQRLTETTDHNQVRELQKEIAFRDQRLKAQEAATEAAWVEFRKMRDENERIKSLYVDMHNEVNNLHHDKHELIDQIQGFAMRFSAAESQVENLIEDNKVLRAAIATIGSIVKVAEQL